MKQNVKALIELKLIERNTTKGLKRELSIKRLGELEDFRNISDMMLRSIDNGDDFTKSNLAILSSIVDYIKEGKTAGSEATHHKQ